MTGGAQPCNMTGGAQPCNMPLAIIVDTWHHNMKGVTTL
jgi:hypothetical protein